MTASFPIQADFSKGELTPLAASRVDIDLWRQSLALCRNFSVMVQGGIRRRSGTRFVAEVADSSEISRLFPFSFNSEQSYVLDINAGGKIQFLAQRGYLGSPYQISHSWTATAIPRLSYTQFNDEARFADKDFFPQLLTRSGDTDWSIANAEFEDGPYLDQNRTSTTLTPADYGSVTPKMTSDTVPSGTTAASAGSTAYLAFDKSEGTTCVLSDVNSGQISYTFDASTTKVADAYYVTADDDDPRSAPARWTFEGYNGSDWVVLDVQESQRNWTSKETRFFEFINDTAYEAYRLNFTTIDGDFVNSRVAELGIHEKAEEQTAFNLTASSTTGVNDDTGFQSTDVGRFISLIASDGKRRWAKITARTSSTVVKIQLYGHALPNLNAIVRWSLGAFSAETGYPALVELYNERVFYGRTDAKPVTVWGTKQGVFNDFGISSPALETDGLAITLLSSDQNELLWLAGDEDLVTGSAKQIRSIGPNDITQAFSATNVTQRKGPKSGAAKIQPLSIGGNLVYVGSGGTKLRELVLNDQNRYVAPDLSVLGEQFFAAGIQGMVYSENPEPTIYAWTGDGGIAAVLYDREQRAVGFGFFEIAGGFVESAAVIPSETDGFNDLYLVVKRTIDEQTKRYIEVLEHPFSHLDGEIEDAFFVDCGLTYDDTAATVISGLGHLEGEDVAVLADGGVVNDLTVTDGSITLPYAASKVHIGLGYTSQARTLPFAGPGQDGYLFGRRVKAMSVYVDVLKTGSLKVGAYAGDRTMRKFEINRKPGNQMFTFAPTLIDGPIQAQVESSWAQGSGQIDMVVEDPLPCLIRSVILQAESEP